MTAAEESSRLIHPPETYRTVPWKNGRGQTLELLSETVPDSDEFRWRLSIAVVDSDGPFSRFAGCDRTLVLLEGRGITLKHRSGEVDNLATRFASAHFSGDVETVSTLHGGPIRDFNVMSRRGHCSAKVDAFEGGAARELMVDGDVLLAYAVDGEARLVSPRGQVIGIAGKHLLQVGRPDRGRWTATSSPSIVTQVYYRR